MSKPRTTLAVTALCLGLLAVAALASPVTAKDGDEDRSGPDRGSDRGNRTMDPAVREQRQAHREAVRENHSLDREARHERMRAAHDAWQECKHDANATGNESKKVRCGDEKSYFLNATKAMREARALHGAIAALERRIGRLEAREIALEHQLDDENLTANETAEIEAKIDSHQERMVERLQALKDRLEARHARWHAVIDADEEAAGSDDSDESESSSESESEDESEDEDETEDDESESESESETSTSA